MPGNLSADRRGRIVDWNDARGFGFIEDPGVEGRVFVHIKDFAVARRPAVGDEVIYSPVVGREGKPAAKRVRIAGVASPRVSGEERTDAPLRVTIRIVGTLMLATAIACCVLFGRAPTWLALPYLACGVISFILYATDKGAAMRGEWRRAETSLHAIDLAFGIGGGLLAQGLLRHKSSKASFAAVSALIYAIHMIGLLALLAGYGPEEWLGWLSA